MSTKIYNGIKFKTKDIYELYDLLNEFKIESSELLKKEFDKYMPTLLKHVMVEYYKKHKKLDSIWDVADNFKKELEIGEFRIQHRNTIQIYPRPKTKELYGYFILDDKSESLLLEKDWVEDYHYQNSSDGPEDISYDDYSKRGDVWDELFAPSYRITDSGFEYVIFDFSNINFFQDQTWKQKFKEFKTTMPREVKMKNVIQNDEI